MKRNKELNGDLKPEHKISINRTTMGLTQSGIKVYGESTLTYRSASNEYPQRMFYVEKLVTYQYFGLHNGLSILDECSLHRCVKGSIFLKNRHFLSTKCLIN